MHCEAIVGNYYWNKSTGRYPGYYKLIDRDIQAGGAAYTFRRLWDHFDKRPIGELWTIPPPCGNDLGIHWRSEESSCIHTYAVSGTFTKCVFNYQDVVSRVEVGSQWVEKEDCRSTSEHLITVESFKCRYNQCGENRPDTICCKRNFKYGWNYLLENYIPAGELVNVGDITTECADCGRDYPYAVASVGFKCWGCKNGA